MTRVVIESPLAAPTRDGVDANKLYALRAFHNALARGEAPFVAHLFYDQAGLLDELIPEQREQGLLAGLTWATQAEICAVYLDRGCSAGMTLGIAQAKRLGMTISYRFLDDVPSRERDAALATAMAIGEAEIPTDPRTTSLQSMYDLPDHSRRTRPTHLQIVRDVPEI